MYYYDQAGNLVQTVPPAGVARFSTDQLDATASNGLTLNEQINAHRSSGSLQENDVLLPNQSLKTQYKYNSLNQLVWQYTPDGGISKFAYDKLGRIIASQNAKQAVNNVYSYTSYDALGRIVEAGEFTPSATLSIEESTGRLVNASGVQIATASNYPEAFAAQKREVTRTVYSKVHIRSAELFDSFTTLNQMELTSRNRVTGIYYFDSCTGGCNKVEALHVLYYTYDIHGNVKELVQQNTLLSQVNDGSFSGLKRVSYNYDLISGNVHKVYFQKGKIDQFVHKYTYDADNRIVSVATSSDNKIWETDANYQYYLHGPLARVELGEQKVQGLDYAYTLHGWLKGVNTDHLSSENDMGSDGGETSTTAKDVFGYALNYYKNDYTPIGTINAFTTSSNAMWQHSKNVYNGNIKQMTTALRDQEEQLLSTQLNHYTYDQLNRIKAMQGHRIVNGSSTRSYTTGYSYDNNGNLLTLSRGTKSGMPGDMDNLSYSYKTKLNPITGSIEKTNQLDHVSDAIGDGVFEIDIDNQQEGNYTYDEIGQLVKDVKEGIRNIEWRVDGKVSRITKSNGVTIGFQYDGLGNRIAKTVFPENKTTVYSRDAQGNVMAIYEVLKHGTNQKKVLLTEHHIYGSSRLGLEQKYLEIPVSGDETPSSTLLVEKQVV